MAEQAEARGGIQWRNVITVGSAAILIGVEILGASIATGWAIAGLFGLGDVGAYVLEALFGIAAVVVIVGFVRSAIRVEPLFDR